MKWILVVLLSVVLSVFLLQCTTTKGATKPPVVLKDISEASALLDLVKATNIPYRWFVATGTGTIDWEDQRISARLNVRIRHDSVIWLQISKLGIEVGRILVTPDSAFVINRLEQKFGRYATADFFNHYKLPVDFEMFSKVFTGGAFIPPDVHTMSIEPDGALYLESSTGIRARHWLDISFQLIRSQVMDAGDRQWDAGYAEYGEVNTGQKFPFSRTNMLTEKGEPSIFDITYSSILVDIPHEFPFSIPSHYEKM